MQYTVDGLIVREAAVGDNDKLLTIITPENGKMSVMAKGSRSAKSKTLAPTQIYTYGNYEIYEKGDYKWLRGASIIESFFEMRNTIEGISLAAYLADVALEASFKCSAVLTFQNDLTKLQQKYLFHSIYTSSNIIRKLKCAILHRFCDMDRLNTFATG